MASNKDTPMIEDGTNYGDFLLKTIEGAKDQFTDEEYKKLVAGAEQIKEIEGKLTILEQKYPECANAPSNGDSVPADSNGVISKGGGATSFPSFDGKDLDGIVGEPIVGAITEKNQAKTLEKLIDQALQVK